MASDVLEEIAALFTWNPPRLIPGPKRSTKTCPPSFYDKHLSDNMVLKRVERLPSLVQDLAKNVDTALEAILRLNTLPPLSDFTTAARRKYEIDLSSLVATDEKAVANFYDKTTAKYCSPLASTLALHPAASFSQWRSLLFWTQSVSFSMDGQLSFIEEGDDHRAAIEESMDSKIRPIFEDARKSRSPLATWEIKSLSAGPVEVITAVPNLGKFTWTTCTPNCLTDPSIHEEAKRKVKDVVVGPDAQAPLWNFPASENRKEEINIKATPAIPQQPGPRFAAAPGSSTIPLPPIPSRLGSLSPLTPLSSEDSEPSPAKDKGKKRKRDDDDDRPLANHKGKKRQKDEDDEEDEEDEDEAYKDRHDMTAQSLVQQAWAQAVRVDGTVIVLHSGNHELVCVRHRISQTLYVSGVIEPHICVEPGYGKLHIGIYIAAIQDMIDRKQQQPPPISQPKLPGDDGDSIDGDKNQDNNRGSGSGRKDGHGHQRAKRGRGRGRGRGGVGGGKKRGGLQDSAGEKGPTDDELTGIEKTIHVASHRNVVLLYLQYNEYDSPVPASFQRAAPVITAQRCPTPPFSPRALCTYGLEECVTIVLTSEVGRGATGVVHRGTLKPEICDGAMALDVVVKLGFDAEQRDALRSEYEVYRCLSSKGVHRGIATTLGLFDDSEGCACALVMLYAGVPVSRDSQGNLSTTSYYKSALSTLESIHCAGILHGDIRLENILVGGSGITIIDFGHSKRCNNQGAKDKEFAQLRSFLSLAGKSQY